MLLDILLAVSSLEWENFDNSLSFNPYAAGG